MPENFDVNDTSWRKISQTGTRSVTTPQARQRRWKITYKAAGLIVLVVALLGLTAYSIYFLKSNPDLLRNNRNVAGEPVRRFLFNTDGVLTEDWLRATLDISPTLPLTEVDIFAIKAELEKIGQVREVTVEKVFPDALRVDLKEQQPILRVGVKDRSGQRQILLISNAGVVYPGYLYNDAALRRLPFADGLKLVRRDAGFDPVPGMANTSQFLDTLRTRAPAIYAQCRILDLKDFDGRPNAPWAVYTLRTRDYGQIVFSPRNVEEQLVRLDNILANLAQNNITPDRIDLSIPDQAPVKYTQAAKPKTGASVKQQSQQARPSGAANRPSATPAR